MKFLSNLHTHSTFSDGAHTPEQIVEKAISLGFVSLGISDHSYTDVVSSYCMKKDRVHEYINDIDRLKQKYKDKIEIYKGIEWDYCTPDREYENVEFDYVIGGVHYFNPLNNKYYDVDYIPKVLQDVMNENNMEVQDLIKHFYDLTAKMILKVKPDIVAHIDLITKFNEDKGIFDDSKGWYLDLVKQVLQEIKKAGCIVEINTGAISRGYRKQPYPSKYILEQVLQMNIPITISSDSHHKDTIDYFFDESLVIARAIGFTSVKMMKGGKFVDVAI